MNTRSSTIILAVIGILSCASSPDASADAYKLAWTRSGFFNQRDIASDVVVDSNDKVYIGGETGPIYGPGSAGGSVGLVARYNSTGTQEWLTQTYSTPQADQPRALAIDSSNNVFIAGDTYRYAGAEAFLAKFNQNGGRLWEAHIGSQDNEFDGDVAVDLLGNAYMSGSTTGDLGVGSNGQGYDGFIAKYGPNGNKLWTMQFPDSLGDRADTISIDSAGNMYVAGSIGPDTYVAKLDSNRNVLWRLTPNYSGTAARHTEIYESAIDASGNLYLVGASNSLYESSRGFLESDAVVAKYNPSGTLLWQRQLSLRTLDVLYGVTLDAAGNVYVAGQTLDSPFGFIGATNPMWAKYDSSGNQLWVQEFGTAEFDGAQGIAVDHAGHVYVTGNVFRDINNYHQADSDAFLARFDLVPEPNALVMLAMFGLPALVCQRRRKLPLSR